MSHNHTHPESGCEICAIRRPFEIPDHLLDEIRSGNAVVFAGAGVSTESRSVLKYTLYDFIAGELGQEDENLSFPDLMEAYERMPNGRVKLIQSILDRLEHIRSFPELHRDATDFHRELSTLPGIHTIVTTNWDDFFEQECHAMPIVFSKDVAFWNAANRRVLKIHGTINNVSSIIATKTDYERCKSDLAQNLIGAQLKNILATSTVIFVGYSLRDDDFLSILQFVSEQMERFSGDYNLDKPNADSHI